MMRDVINTEAMARNEAPINIEGSEVTPTVDRNSASRVAFPATWCAIMKTAANVAQVAAVLVLERPVIVSYYTCGRAESQRAFLSPDLQLSTFHSIAA